MFPLGSNHLANVQGGRVVGSLGNKILDPVVERVVVLGPDTIQSLEPSVPDTDGHTRLANQTALAFSPSRIRNQNRSTEHVAGAPARG
jgi:hypothetical protein